MNGKNGNEPRKTDHDIARSVGAENVTAKAAVTALFDRARTLYNALSRAIDADRLAKALERMKAYENQLFDLFLEWPVKDRVQKYEAVKKLRECMEQGIYPDLGAQNGQPNAVRRPVDPEGTT